MGRLPKTFLVMVAAISNPVPPLFTGEFRHSIDGKGRITVPSEWRFEEEGTFFLIPSSAGTCLKVMPREEVDRILAKAANLDGPQRLETLRAFGSATRQCKLDKAGRLVLPPDFSAMLNLAGDVVMAGAIETFEIWNTNAWDNAKSKTRAVATPQLAQFGL